jgi:RNA polymerase sporulation-specific sigma factor
MQAKEQLMISLQKEPTVDEIARAIGENQQEVVIALESMNDPVSLYDPVYSESGDALYVLDQLRERDAMENWLGELSLRSALTALGKREQNILYRRYFQGQTQTEVAQEIGISQAQVSRLEKQAIAQIRDAAQ